MSTRGYALHSVRLSRSVGYGHWRDSQAFPAVLPRVLVARGQLAIPNCGPQNRKSSGPLAEMINCYFRSRTYLRGLRTSLVHATHRPVMVRSLLSHASVCGNG